MIGRNIYSKIERKIAAEELENIEIKNQGNWQLAVGAMAMVLCGNINSGLVSTTTETDETSAVEETFVEKLNVATPVCKPPKALAESVGAEETVSSTTDESGPLTGPVVESKAGVNGIARLMDAAVHAEVESMRKFASLWNKVRSAQLDMQKAVDEEIMASRLKNKKREADWELKDLPELKERGSMRVVRAGQEAVSAEIDNPDMAQSFSLQVSEGALPTRFRFALKDEIDKATGLIPEQVLNDDTLVEQLCASIAKHIETDAAVSQLLKEAGPILKQRCEVPNLSPEERLRRQREWVIYQWMPEAWYVCTRRHEKAKLAPIIAASQEQQSAALNNHTEGNTVFHSTEYERPVEPGEEEEENNGGLLEAPGFFAKLINLAKAALNMTN